MVRVLRGALVAVAVAGAFVGGYVLKDPAAASSAVAQPALAPGPANATHAAVVPPARPVAVIEPPMPQAPAAEPETLLLPPQPVADRPKPEPVDPSDPAFQMIRKELGHKTTILDAAELPPAVLVAARHDDPPLVPPPSPMAGPPPKLQPLPEIDLAPPFFPNASPPPRLLNSRAVELDFEVTKVGLSKIQAVELWASRDGGVTWQRTDRMDGARPPFRTRLGSEGEYGFKLVIESASGMRTPEPTASTKADLTAELDTTPPVVWVAPLRPSASHPDRVVLSWGMVDKNLDRTGVCLEYSRDGRSWAPIAVLDDPTQEGPGMSAPGTDGNGRGVYKLFVYEWAPPMGLPHEVMVRVTARDKAGNTARGQLPQPVSIDLLAPDGRLTALRCPGWEAEKGPMPRTLPTGSAGRPTPAILRAGLAALLNSPLLFPPTTRPARQAANPSALDVTGNGEPAQPSSTKGSWGPFSGPGVRLDF